MIKPLIQWSSEPKENYSENMENMIAILHKDQKSAA